MKRKFLMIFCAAALSVGLLAGCGTEAKDEAGTENDAKTQDEQEPQESTESGVSMPVDDEQAKEAVDEEEAEAAGFSDGTDVEEENAAGDDKDSSAQAENGAGEVKLDTSELLKGIHHAEFTIKDYGTIKMELDADTAPVTVTNFVNLIQDDFYDGLTFHRIIDGFMMQGGDPLGNGKGGSDNKIKGEFSSNGVKNDISHTRGTLSMARATDPDSASSQFFIVQSDSVFLDGDYASFGHVTEGMEVVDAICKDAKPTDNNGSIKKSEQPVIESVMITD